MKGDMRLKEVIAEWHYLKEEIREQRIVPFAELNSNVRDRYFRTAYNELPHLVASYLGNRGAITKLIRGCIRNFINAHGVELNKGNAESLVKRITSQLRKEPTKSTRENGGGNEKW